MKLIDADTLASAWLQASGHLLGRKGWTDTTIVLHVSNPAVVHRPDQDVADILDDFLVSHGQYSHHTVAETIFPGYEYITHGVEGVFRIYPEEVFPRIRDHEDMRHWGTYAYRLLRRRDENGKEYNPLEFCIRKMKDKVRKRAAYELGLGFGFDLATYDDDDDRGDRMGGPCLSHLSFKVIDGHVHLAAMYRSHYYVHRAFGNLLGLARLQSFVADQIELPLGPLVCHSTMAVLESGSSWGWSKGEIPPLVRLCEEALATRRQEYLEKSELQS
jgi:hypothetical protein